MNIRELKTVKKKPKVHFINNGASNLSQAKFSKEKQMIICNIDLTSRNIINVKHVICLRHKP